MSSDLAEHWWRRLQMSPFREAAALTKTGLAIGHDTLLLRFDAQAGLTLEADPAHDRLVALLAVAGTGRVPAEAVAEIELAFDHWRRGDRALAAIRLAFASLPRLASPDDAYRLFLADVALDAGVSPRELLAELGYTEGSHRF